MSPTEESAATPRRRRADAVRNSEAVLEAAKEAGQITLKYFRHDDLDVELKCDDTPVTAADRDHMTPAHLEADLRLVAEPVVRGHFAHEGRALHRSAWRKMNPVRSNADHDSLAVAEFAGRPRDRQRHMKGHFLLII